VPGDSSRYNLAGVMAAHGSPATWCVCFCRRSIGEVQGIGRVSVMAYEFG
jgi:hypothetical protein